MVISRGRGVACWDFKNAGEPAVSASHRACAHEANSMRYGNSLVAVLVSGGQTRTHWPVTVLPHVAPVTDADVAHATVGTVGIRADP